MQVQGVVRAMGAVEGAGAFEGIGFGRVAENAEGATCAFDRTDARELPPHKPRGNGGAVAKKAGRGPTRAAEGGADDGGESGAGTAEPRARFVPGGPVPPPGFDAGHGSSDVAGAYWRRRIGEGAARTSRAPANTSAAK